MADNSAPNDPATVKLQEELNTYRARTHPGEPPLETNGNPKDPDTMKAWVDFKKNGWADGRLSSFYLMDAAEKGGLGMTKEELQTAGMQFDDKGKLLFDRNKPPSAELTKAVQHKLGVPENGNPEDPMTKDAILMNKREHWVDARVNQGAVADLHTVNEQHAKETAPEKPGHNDHTEGRPREVLKEGSKGNNVRMAQVMLSKVTDADGKAYYDGAIDGDAGGKGSKFEQAAIRYQHDHPYSTGTGDKADPVRQVKEDSTGVIGDRTWGSLISEYQRASGLKNPDGTPHITGTVLKDPITLGQLSKDSRDWYHAAPSHGGHDPAPGATPAQPKSNFVSPGL